MVLHPCAVLGQAYIFLVQYGAVWSFIKAELNLIVLHFKRVYFLSEDMLVQDILGGKKPVRTPCGKLLLHIHITNI